MSKDKVILHISNTDIRIDSRILKELQSIENFSGYKVVALGLFDEDITTYKKNDLQSEIHVFKSFTKNWTFLPRPVRYSFVLIESMFKILKRGISLSPKIVHCHDTLFLPIAFILKLVCGSKLIYDAHELESDKNSQSKLLSWGTLLIEKIAWRKIDLLITVSPSIIDWYNKNLGSKNSVLILNSPIISENDNTNSSHKDYLRHKFNIPSDNKIFILLGILGKGRGIEICLDVFTQKEINSHVVFMGFGEYVEKIQKLATIHNNIHFHPSVPHDEVVSIAKSADIGLCLIEAVSLSDYYCLPNKLFEYAFAGLHVLASDFPDIRELVLKYSLGVCSNLEYTEVLKAVNRLESFPLAKIDANLYELSWAYQSEKLVEEYKKILKLDK
jgi:glycosyltransferase involved in cell wall biosynthesis